jgi:hypothetical protein
MLSVCIALALSRWDQAQALERSRLPGFPSGEIAGALAGGGSIMRPVQVTRATA